VNLHRVGRLSRILVVSQVRSGRASSDPGSFFGRPYAIAFLDLAAFLGAFAVVAWGLESVRISTTNLATLANDVFPFLPLVSVAAVLIAGVMFELTNTARFSGSDAANWLPITPSEYVAASSAAIAYSYTPAIALLLGGLLPIAVAGGVAATYLLCAGLSAVGLYQGGVLVEMVRATTQRSSGFGSGRRGQLGIVFRAALLVVIILAFDLAFNPVFLLAFLQRFSTYSYVTALVPFLWSTRGLTAWVSGDRLLGSAFALAQLGFVGLLVYLAGALRVRFWVPAASEIQISPAVSARGHPFLAMLGLSPAEAAIVSKDLRGFVRRREMLPTLVVPIVLIVLMLVEGSAIGAFGSVLWMGWVAGFFALLLAVTSVGQERRSFQSFYAYPISARAVLRAKATAVLLPALVGAAAMAIVIGFVFALAPLAVAAFVLVNGAGAVLLTLWGLVFAARFSDFQERPRPQYLRPGAMLGAMGSGMVLLFAVLVPAALAVLSAWGPDSLGFAAWTVAFALAASALAIHWARTGFDRLFREIPV
jgi:hypothetical protein